MIKEVTVVHSSLRYTWKLFPEVASRIAAFSERYESRMDREQFENYLRLCFVSQKPTALMLAGLDEDGIVVGHTVAIAEQWFGTPVCTIVQLEVDKGEKLTRAVWEQSEGLIRLFCKAHKIETIQIAARNEAVARLFGRQGFVRDRILMHWPLDG